MKIFRFLKRHDKRRFRLFARSAHHLIADFWAKDQAEAYEIATELQIDQMRAICDDDSQIVDIREIGANDEEFAPFKPVN